jgi:hypothetical protein
MVRIAIAILAKVLMAALAVGLAVVGGRTYISAAQAQVTWCPPLTSTCSCPDGMSKNGVCRATANCPPEGRCTCPPGTFKGIAEGECWATPKCLPPPPPDVCVCPSGKYNDGKGWCHPIPQCPPGSSWGPYHVAPALRWCQLVENAGTSDVRIARRAEERVSTPQ